MRGTRSVTWALSVHPRPLEQWRTCGPGPDYDTFIASERHTDTPALFERPKSGRLRSCARYAYSQGHLCPTPFLDSFNRAAAEYGFCPLLPYPSFFHDLFAGYLKQMCFFFSVFQ